MITAPPSKSVSHRMLMAAALASGASHIKHVLESKDLERTREILCAAGAEICQEDEGSYFVQGMSGKPRGGSKTPLSCDAYESGTTCRLLTALLAAGKGSFYIHGAPRLHERPLGDLSKVLETLGVTFVFHGKRGCPPLTLMTHGLYPPKNGICRIALDESSQYLSGLLLAAPLAHGDLILEIEGSKVVSWSYVGLTLHTLELFGIPFVVEKRFDSTWQAVDWHTIHEVSPGSLRFKMQPALYKAGTYIAEGDWSGASYFLAAGAVGKKPISVLGLNTTSLQGDRAILRLLQKMGARVEIQKESVSVFPSPLHGIEVDMSDCPDLVPTLAIVAAFASGETVIKNVAHLRIKESDRLAAPAEELARIGIQSRQKNDGIAIQGLGHAPLITNVPFFSSHGDHRMAMSLALLELAGQRIHLDDPDCVSKSFPTFWKEWNKCLESN